MRLRSGTFRLKREKPLLVGKDPWVTAVRPAVSSDYDTERPLLEHLATATASRPSGRWLASAKDLLGTKGAALLELLLRSAAETEAVETGRDVWDGRTYIHTLWLSDPSSTLIRGCLWATTTLEDEVWVPEIAGLLAERALRQEDIRVGNAAAFALGESSRPEAIAVLSRLALRVKDRRFLKGIEKALERAAEIRGLSRGQLRESVVPTFELGSDGTIPVTIGDARATIRVDPPGTVGAQWIDAAGRSLKSPPASVREARADELKALKQRVAEIRRELGTQRLRLETLLAADRVWTLDEWRRHYLEHPLVQTLTRRLVWRFDGVAAMPLEPDRAVGLRGDLPLPTADEIRLWHPLGETPETIAEWRALLRARELVQPFKQVFREVYLVAPAEEETDTYSNRFAAHILRYPQTYALMKQRDWNVVALGPYDNDGGRQWKDFPEHGIRAEFWVGHVDEGWNETANLSPLAATDQVRFYREEDPEPLSLLDVPPVVFSEAMRDVDMFVGVTSVGADPEWLDHGPDRYHAYWREFSFGGLSQSAELRREALAELLPSLRIADRCMLTDKYLVVEGRIRTYKIHLGSGNVLMEPNGQYLCIVASRGRSPGRVYLPFPEDERFSVILSKALLLADDDRITDRSILAQIR